MVITGTTGNRVYPKRVPRVQIPPAPPEQKAHPEGCAFLFASLGIRCGFDRIGAIITRQGNGENHSCSTRAQNHLKGCALLPCGVLRSRKIHLDDRAIRAIRDAFLLGTQIENSYAPLKVNETIGIIFW